MAHHVVIVKQLLQCDANSRDGEQSMNCIFYPDSGSVRTGQMNGIVWLLQCKPHAHRLLKRFKTQKYHYVHLQLSASFSCRILGCCWPKWRLHSETVGDLFIRWHCSLVKADVDDG